MMSRTKHARIAGVSSLVFVLLVGIVILLVPPFPSSATPPGEVQRYYAANRFPFLVGNYLAMLSLIPGMVVSAYLIQQTKIREGEGGWIWILMTLAASIQAATGGTVLILYQATAAIAASGDVSITKAVSDLSGISFAMYFVPLFVFQAMMAVASLRFSVLPRWIGWAGALAALSMEVAGLGAVFPEHRFLAGGGFATWVGFGAFCFSSASAGIWLALP